MSLEAKELVNLVKRAAVDAVAAANPMHLCFGDVVSTTPLRIELDQKLTLTQAQLLLTSAVQDCTIDMTVDWTSESVSHGHRVVDTYTGAGDALPVDHAHPIRGRKSITLHRGLIVGDKVLLLRCDGGQLYIVLDKVG